MLGPVPAPFEDSLGVVMAVDYPRCSGSFRLFFCSWSWCDQDSLRDEGDAVYVEACVDAVVVIVVDAEVAIAAFAAAVDGSTYDSVVVVYSAGEIFYRYRRRNFSKSHLHLVFCSACSEWRTFHCLVRAYELGCCCAREVVQECEYRPVAS